MFIAHYLSGWLGISTGIVIAVLLVLRRGGKALRARRKQRSSTDALRVEQKESRRHRLSPHTEAPHPNTNSHHESRLA